MGMHPDVEPTRFTADVGTLFALYSEYSAARKRRGDLLRLAVKSIKCVLNEAVSERIPDGPASALDPKLHFKPYVPLFARE